LYLSETKLQPFEQIKKYEPLQGHAPALKRSQPAFGCAAVVNPVFAVYLKTGLPDFTTASQPNAAFGSCYQAAIF
jgi:hypothetical protein